VDAKLSLTGAERLVAADTLEAPLVVGSAVDFDGCAYADKDDLDNDSNNNIRNISNSNNNSSKICLRDERRSPYTSLRCSCARPANSHSTSL
jgi:hypothetical protein